jgi:hypothetical protein
MRERACLRREESAYGDTSKSVLSSRFPFPFGLRPRSVTVFDLAVELRAPLDAQRLEQSGTHSLDRRRPSDNRFLSRF